MNAKQKFLELNLNGPPIRIGVIGDAMVDEYYDIQMKKMSPEFPIPVILSQIDDPTVSLPGGAANVAYQFKHFNVTPKLIAFSDPEADDIFSKNGLDLEFCIHTTKESFWDKDEHKIPRKRRFYSGEHPISRWDVERKGYGLKELEYSTICYRLYEKVVFQAKHFDVFIFSDYDKGVLSNKYMNLLISAAPISIVDPKNGDIKRWKGCTVFKPNAQEALSLSGQPTLDQAGWWFTEQLDCKAVIITKANQGVSVFLKDGLCKFDIAPEKELPPAQSVIGAGDCFVAFLAMALGRGMSIVEAAELAFHAGTRYVRNRHNKPLTCFDIMDKIVDPKLLEKRDFDLFMANGCFDILHNGHVELLKFAKSQGGKLVVAVNTDKSVSGLKPGRPIINIDDRMNMLAALDCVDYVVAFDESTPLNLIQQLKPTGLVKGAEYKEEDVVGYGVAPIILFPMIEGLSTTMLIEKIKAQLKTELFPEVIQLSMESPVWHPVTH